MRYPIRIDPPWRALFATLFLRPSGCHVDVDREAVQVQMGWAFRASIARSAIRRVARDDRWRLSRGVHGFAGRWLVNGSGEGVVALELAPSQRARVMGFPVRLRQLLVSVEDPAALIEALGR